MGEERLAVLSEGKRFKALREALRFPGGLARARISHSERPSFLGYLSGSAFQKLGRAVGSVTAGGVCSGVNRVGGKSEKVPET